MGPKDWIPVIVQSVAALVIVTGWLVTHHQRRTLQLRKDRLDLINRQLSEFYGPLHVACVAGAAAYNALLAKHGLSPDGDLFEEGRQLARKEEIDWYHWMEQILMPLNEIRLKVLLEKIHLVRGTKTYQVRGNETTEMAEITRFAEHVAAYRVILAKWKDKDFGEKYGRTDFPKPFSDIVAMQFYELKKEQDSLLGLLKK